MMKSLLKGFILVFFIFDSIRCDEVVITSTPTVKPTTHPSNGPRYNQKICSASGENCHCSPVEHSPEYIRVDCSHKNLNQTPPGRDFPPKTLILDLSRNNIVHVTKFEKFDTLNHLSLSTNGITKIEPLAFEHLPEIAYLDLSFNQLEELPITLFESLKELQRLNISNNKIKFIPLNLFKNNGFLIELNMANNPIEYIYPDAFSHLHELEILDMAHLRIYSLPNEMFGSIKKIHRLDLSDNRFQDVPNQALQTISQLQVLDMSKNPIRILNRNSFDGLQSLIQLKLNEMPNLTKVKQNTFSQLTNLELLELSYNPQLSLIDEHAFTGMFNHERINIKSVNFRRNQLRKLSEHTLPFCNLTFLDLRENPWECNCHVHWIKYCHGPKEFESGILCATPDHFNGQELVEIDQKNLVCHGRYHEGAHRMLLFASLFFMTGVFVSIGMVIFRNQITSYYGSRKKEGSIYYVRAQGQQQE